MSEVPEGALVNAQIEVVQYIDRDAEVKFTVRYEGDVPISSLLGLLRLAEDALLRESRAW